MKNTTDQLRRIQTKLQQLLKQYTLLQKENTRLCGELEAARAKIEAHQKNADELKQQVSILKLSSGEMSGPDKKELEKRINGYLKEIDRCIDMISR